MASAARFEAGDRAWVRALKDAQASLAADGVHLTEQGDVLDEPPRAPWKWDEDAADVPRAQHALTKA